MGQSQLNKFSDTKECAKTEFQCINGEKCIDKQNVCNGYFDCQGKFILATSAWKPVCEKIDEISAEILFRNKEKFRWF